MGDVDGLFSFFVNVLRDIFTVTNVTMSTLPISYHSSPVLHHTNIQHDACLCIEYKYYSYANSNFLHSLGFDELLKTLTDKHLKILLKECIISHRLFRLDFTGGRYWDGGGVEYDR